jgi:SAM-dependent methyltransferase
MAQPRTTFPEGALDWLTESAAGPVLSMSTSTMLPKLLAKRYDNVFFVDREVKRANAVRSSLNVTPIVARPEALPFVTCNFGFIHLHQSFLDFAPGLALPELARVLKSSGRLATSYFARDDSVPWVRRLIRLMQSVDPDAMSGIDENAIKPLLTSKYFPHVETRKFRIWVPINRDDMLNMVAHEPVVATLPETQQRHLISQAGEIYDSATSGNHLRLPYQLICHRAQVDHSDLTGPLRLRGDDALVISF